MPPLDLCLSSSSLVAAGLRRHAAVARALVVSALLGAVTAPAHAQNAADKAAAEQLFKDARALMSAERHEEACPKLEASLRLDEALGTRLNLAACYERIGKLASAWGMYHEAADLAAKEQQPKRVKFAQGRAKVLEPRLPRLIVAVPAAARVAGLRLTRDGTELPRALFGTPIYVDPGPRVIEASAPGHVSRTFEITAVEGKEESIEVTKLEELPPPPSAPAPAPAPRQVPALVPEPPAPLDDRGRPRRLVGVGVAATGVIGVGVGLAFGAWAKSTWDDAKTDGKCDLVTDQCTPAGQRLAQDARTRATISTVAVAAGATLIVAGTVIYLTAPSPRRRVARGARVAPSVGAGVVGAVVAGTF